ncbi:amino acid transporter [Bacillus sp. JJ1764]|uniref:amino acid transporter n=1 Tax=Bacillus sp. JJ1764 TaxID=3122964 RepID=UPI002FFE04EB
MKKEKQPYEETQPSEKMPPFNDAIDYFNTIEGNVGDPKNANLKKVPKPIRLIGYFIIFFFVVAFLLILILSIVK